MPTADVLRRMRGYDPRTVGNDALGDSVPVEQRLLQAIMQATGGYMTVPAGVGLAQGVLQQAPKALASQAGAIFPKEGLGPIPYANNVKETLQPPLWIDQEFSDGGALMNGAIKKLGLNEARGIQGFTDDSSLLPGLMQEVKSDPSRGYGAQDSYAKAVEVLKMLRNSVLQRSQMLQNVDQSLKN
jgi:hypothetical protein